jgi:DNA-binding Lrp family transcriptional regulator
MAYKLDLTDKKLLSELDKNSRQPISTLAKKLRKSRNSILYRMQKLKEEGIIISLSGVVDPAKFGLTSWKVYIKFNDKTKELDDRVINFLKNNKKLWWIIQCEGNFDFMFCILSNSVHEFYKTLNDFQTKFSKYESRIEITTHINTDLFSRGYFLGKESEKVCETLLKEPVKEKVDELDIKIMKLLFLDSRISLVDLAMKARTTPRVVEYRIKDLLKRHIITHFRLIPDVNKLSMDYYKVMVNLKDISPETEQDLRYFCEKDPNIINCSDAWGPWEFEFEVEIENYKALINLMNQFRDKFSRIIKNIQYVLISKEIKETNNFLEYMGY